MKKFMYTASLLMSIGLAQGASKHSVVTMTNLTASSIIAINGETTYFFDKGSSKVAAVSGKSPIILQFAADSAFKGKVISINPPDTSWADMMRKSKATLYILQFNDEVRAMWGSFLQAKEE